MDERVFFHLSEVLPDDTKVSSASGGGSVAENSVCTGAESSPEAVGSFATASANSGGSGKPIIRRGQEVAFRIGQRQGKPLGLRVRKLPPGTLPTEESLPGRFVGVVVVPPRNININIGTDKEKVGALFFWLNRLHFCYPILVRWRGVFGSSLRRPPWFSYRRYIVPKRSCSSVLSPGYVSR